MNVAEMLANVKAVTHPATNMDAFIRRQLNRAQKVFISKAKAKRSHKFSWMILSDQLLTTVASQESYAISPLARLGKAIQFRETEGKRQLVVLTRKQFNERVPNPTVTGNPEYAYFKEFWAVSTQPTSASILTLVSSSISDVGKVKIEGLTTAGVLIGEEVTLNGTNAVTTVNSYAKILNRSDDAARVGTLTITSNAGAVTNLVLGQRMRQAKFPVFGLYPIPSGALPIYYDAEMVLPEILNDADMSLIPEDYHDGLENYAGAIVATVKGDKALASMLMGAFDERVMDAVDDDSGPEQIIQRESWGDEGGLGKGTLPGMFPRDN